MGHLLASHLMRPLPVHLELINPRRSTNRLIPHIPILLAHRDLQANLRDTPYLPHTTILSLTPLPNNLSPVQVRLRTHTRLVRVPLHSRQL